MQRRANLLIVCFFTTLFSGVAVARDVVADLTSHRVEVRFEFSGANLTLFGAVAGEFPQNATLPDIVVIVRGPEAPLVVRKKQRIAAIWINAQSETETGLPGYFAIFSNRPLKNISPQETIRKITLGQRTALLQTVENQKINPDKTDPAEFTKAFFRLKKNREHYMVDPKGVRFIEKNLFRADFRLPADIMTGDYTARVHLFQDGRELSHYDTKFDIKKTGLEGLVFRTAQERPFLYGILAVLTAALSGLGASYFFRNS